MIAVLKQGTDEQKMNALIDWLRARGLDVHISRGEYHTVLGLIGDTAHLDTEDVTCLDRLHDTC